MQMHSTIVLARCNAIQPLSNDFNVFVSEEKNHHKEIQTMGYSQDNFYESTNEKYMIQYGIFMRL